VLIDRGQVKPDSPQFVLNRIAMQDRYMTEIEEKFNGMVRSTVALHETEVCGVPILTRTAEQLFAEWRIPQDTDYA
jgi:hypothetical protein